MPNWCTNKVAFSGPDEDVEKLKGLIGDNKQPISFQKIKPMPPELQIESGSAQIGYEIIYGDAEKVLAYPWIIAAGIKNREEAILHFRENRPELLTMAEKYKFNMDHYGALSWYEWCQDNWGTKWFVDNSDITVLDDLPGYFQLRFDTAWSPPEGIYHAIRELIEAQGINVMVSWFYDEPGMSFSGYL